LEGACAARGPSGIGDVGSDPVRVQALPRTCAGRTAAARCLRGGPGSLLERTCDRIAQAGVDVLGGATDLAIPAVDLVRDDVATRDRAGMDPGVEQVQPADLHRGRGASTLLWHIRQPSDRLGRAGCGPHLRCWALGWRQAGGPQYD